MLAPSTKVKLSSSVLRHLHRGKKKKSSRNTKSDRPTDTLETAMTSYKPTVVIDNGTGYVPHMTIYLSALGASRRVL